MHVATHINATSLERFENVEVRICRIFGRTCAFESNRQNSVQPMIRKFRDNVELRVDRANFVNMNIILTFHHLLTRLCFNLLLTGHKILPWRATSNCSGCRPSTTHQNTIKTCFHQKMRCKRRNRLGSDTMQGRPEESCPSAHAVTTCLCELHMETAICTRSMACTTGRPAYSKVGSWTTQIWAA